MDTINRIARIRALDVNRQEKVSAREESKLFGDGVGFEIAPEDQGREKLFSIFSQQDIHSIVDIENGTPKEIAHIVATNLAMQKSYEFLIATYDNLMEEFRVSLAPTEPDNSWA